MSPLAWHLRDVLVAGQTYGCFRSFTKVVYKLTDVNVPVFCDKSGVFGCLNLTFHKAINTVPAGCAVLLLCKSLCSR